MEYKMNVITVIVKCILLLVFVSLVLIGQKSISYTGLLTMMVGLAGILALLYEYNRKHR